MQGELITAIEQHIIDTATRLRLKNNLSMHEFGKIIGARGSFIGNVENPNYRSKYNLKHINRLASHFDISPKYFLPETPL